MSLLEQRIATLQRDCNPHPQLLNVEGWVARRPSFGLKDADPNFMGRKCIPSEVKEVTDEIEKYGTENYSDLLHRMEQADIYFFLFALAASRHISLDWEKILSQINGIGARSSIYDQMCEVSVNMSPESVEYDLVRLFQLLLSNSAAMPEPFDLDTFLKMVMRKNSGNYPSFCFSNFHPVTGKKLNLEELELMNAHARRCLRIIRDFHRNALNKDVTHGIKHPDSIPYLHLIKDFPNSTRAQGQLSNLLYIDNHLPVPQNLVL